jgi:hypothetical protein
MLKFLSFLFCICLVSGVHADERLIELKCQALVNFRDEAHVKHLSVENFVFSIQSQPVGHVFWISGDTHIRFHASTKQSLNDARQRIDVDSNEWVFKMDQSLLTLHIVSGQLSYEETQAMSGSRVVNASGRCTLPLDPLSLN